MGGERRVQQQEVSPLSGRVERLSQSFWVAGNCSPIAQSAHLSPSVFSDGVLVAWNWLWREYLHKSFRSRFFILLLKHLPGHHCATCLGSQGPMPLGKEWLQEFLLLSCQSYYCVLRGRLISVSCVERELLATWASSSLLQSPDFPFAAAAAKSLQSCPTLCDPIDSSPPSSPVPGILQARTLEWVAISFSNAWMWKVKGKSLSRVWL